jgi:hypothetical protein
LRRLYDGQLVAVDRSSLFPGAMEFTLKRSQQKFVVGSASARELRQALSAVLSAEGAATRMPPMLRCASCGREIGPRFNLGNVVQRCPHCHTLGFWPKLGA